MSEPQARAEPGAARGAATDEGAAAGSGPGGRRRRSRRAVKSAAKLLQKEARGILKKHGVRIAAEPADAIRASVGAIDTLRAKDDWHGVEDEAERLDELLHQHAAFARKSAIRETAENVLIAVMVALGLRSCFYEPFKIPSGSMMPTLRAGDHIFVNKFVYGIQIPFTTTVLGESLGHIERGDVVVFRYPLDESEDFIKRVIGLAGDEVRVIGREVAIKRAGDDDFEVLAREPLSERCLDEAGVKTVGNCQLYHEHLDGKTYVVRYVTTVEDRDDLVPKPRTWKVPPGHLLVMGDNRNLSHDSLQWNVEVEAVGADNLLTLKDLRDLTADNQFTLQRDDGVVGLDDGRHDAVTYLASHRSQSHDLTLAVWRKPTLGATAVFETVGSGMAGGRPSTMAELLTAARGGPERDRALELGAGIDRIVSAHDPDQRQAVALLEDLNAVLHLRCGTGVCKDDASLGLLLAEAVAKFRVNDAQDARTLLEAPKAVRYTTHWTGRTDAREHLFERVLVRAGKRDAGPRDRVRLRAFRKPEEGTSFVRDAALWSLGSSTGMATRVPALGEDALQVNRPEGSALVLTDAAREIVVVLECGSSLCAANDELMRLGKIVAEGMPAAAGDRRKLRVLLTSGEIAGVEEQPVGLPELVEYDRVQLEGTVRGPEHTLAIEAWLRPDEGVAAKLAALGTEAQLAPEPGLADGGLMLDRGDAYVMAFAVPASQTVVRLECRKGLCPERDDALALGHRAAAKAVDPTNFIDPAATRPRPFVPRGNVKGRAERIWLPLARFWLPIE
ncbi:MAG: signal peptidase I [Nannocystaceae bacterium]|nr:signal peptidase I [Nannocystaceae bacterium]